MIKTDLGKQGGGRGPHMVLKSTGRVKEEGESHWQVVAPNAYTCEVQFPLASSSAHIYCSHWSRVDG